MKQFRLLLSGTIPPKHKKQPLKQPVLEQEVQVHDLQADCGFTFTYSCMWTLAGMSHPQQNFAYLFMSKVTYTWTLAAKPTLRLLTTIASCFFYPFYSADTTVKGVWLQANRLNIFWLKMTLSKQSLQISLWTKSLILLPEWFSKPLSQTKGK